MTASIIDGKKVSLTIRESLKNKISKQMANGKPQPGLAVILVGNDDASALYVQKKGKACKDVGIFSLTVNMPEDTKQADLASKIHELNNDERIHGILLQLPLPEHLDAGSLLEKIDPKKDVDGFHPYNMGRLAIRQPLLRPCTPYGIIKLLSEYDLTGKHAVVVSASNIVGRPMALELLLCKCTVTVCHRFTNDLASHVLQADILISAIGKTGIVKSEWIKPGSIVIDVGINRLEDGRVVGDIDFETAKQRASFITPVPGGVGPMTIATLLSNTYFATYQCSV